MYLKSLLPGILLLFASLTHAQQAQPLEPCGTTDGRVQWLQDYQKSPSAYPRSNTTLYVPITVHLVGTSTGSGFFSIEGVLNAFCTLNEDFSEAGIQFFIEGPIRYHSNNNWYDHTFQQGAQMMSQRNVPNTINCYIVESPAGNCGYSMYNLGIALAKSCTSPYSHTWAHEIGHYLSLPHPFYGWEGESHDFNEPAPAFVNGNLVERVDGENCQIAGDGFCDTPADYLNYRWGCNNQGFSNANQKDPTGEVFKSDGSFFMSYSLDVCGSRFSDEQIAAMQANLLTERSNLLYNQTPMDPVVLDQFNIISPMEGDSIPMFQSVTFEWEPIENATAYILEITILETFQVALYRYHVQGTTAVSDELKKNRKYYWRVRAYNPWNTCLVLTDINTFKTGDEITVSEFSAAEPIQVFSVLPNPVASGSDIRLLLDAPNPTALDVSILAISGQTVFRQQYQAFAGEQTISLPGADLPAGLYFIQLRSENGIVSRKFVVGN